MSAGARISWMLQDLKFGRGCNSEELAALQESPDINDTERAQLALLLSAWSTYKQQLQATFEAFRHYDDEV